MQKPYKKENSSRAIFSVRLLQQLLDSGRDFKCEVKNCKSQELEVHHIIPVSVLVDHSNSNIAILCRDHHALVERFYWDWRSSLYPESCAEIKTIALQFKLKLVPPSQLTWFETKSKKLWRDLNGKEEFLNIQDWQETFKKAKRWASSVKTLRKVDPKNAITEDPWFSRIKRPEVKIISVINKKLRYSLNSEVFLSCWPI